MIDKEILLRCKTQYERWHFAICKNCDYESIQYKPNDIEILAYSIQEHIKIYTSHKIKTIIKDTFYWADDDYDNGLIKLTPHK